MRCNILVYGMAGYLFFSAIGTQIGEQAMPSDVRDFSERADARNKIVDNSASNCNPIVIFMCGDVMTGRGIDQILPHPGDPTIHEPYMKSARGYLEIAEQLNGPIEHPVRFSYIWGDALKELVRAAPDVKIINLETSITKSDNHWKGKSIQYRMHPANISTLTTAKIDVCSLANNHVLDWGYPGLLETLEVLKDANIKAPGAGRDLLEAQAAAVLDVSAKRRVIVFAFGLETSGIPKSWGAGTKKAGVNLLRDLSDNSLGLIQEKIGAVKRKGDIVAVSIHWGGNWGYEISGEQTRFAHRLIDKVGVDIIHGHSSHHVKALEVYKDKLILYGCGDFINDYEGIGGYEEFRADLALMYFATLDSSTGKLLDLQMTPTQIRRFKVNRASNVDARWLRDILNREGKAFGTKVELTRDDRLILQWD